MGLVGLDSISFVSCLHQFIPLASGRHNFKGKRGDLDHQFNFAAKSYDDEDCGVDGKGI